jgi:hypothetical protein
MNVRMKVMNVALAEKNQKEFGAYFELSESIKEDLENVGKRVSSEEIKNVQRDVSAVRAKLEELRGLGECLAGCGFELPRNYGEYAEQLQGLQARLDERYATNV